MLQFAVSFPDSRPSISGKALFNFATQGDIILFAGSRHITLSQRLCFDLISGFDNLGASFLTGCARGTDQSFRQAFIDLDLKDRVFIGTAFNKKAESMDLPAKKVVPAGLKPAVALARRTVFLANKADLVVLFPSNPIGPGTKIAFNTAIAGNKPVFLVQEADPEESSDYSVFPSSLFGVVQGYWCLPTFYKDDDSDQFFM